jgi:hypothetical protein
LQSGLTCSTRRCLAFKNARVANIDLRINETLRYNLTMEIASLGTNIEVTLDARDVLAVSSASVGEALTESQVTALPLVGGDVLDLISVLPGFRAGNSTPGTNVDTFAGISSNSINTGPRWPERQRRPFPERCLRHDYDQPGHGF